MHIFYSLRWFWNIINYWKQRLCIQKIKSKSPPRPIPLMLCTSLPKIKHLLRLHSKDNMSMCNIKRSLAFGKAMKSTISISLAYLAKCFQILLSQPIQIYILCLKGTDSTNTLKRPGRMDCLNPNPRSVNLNWMQLEKFQPLWLQC